MHYLLIISAPSGCGKSTVVRRLAQLDEKLTVSVSTTTRAKRPHEIHGKHYYFVTRNEFEQSVQAGEFLEHAEVYGEFYGTSQSFVDEQLQAGRDVLFDIDWQGAQSIKQSYHHGVSFFLLPPSIEELRHRLVQRGQDSDDLIEYRMTLARQEIEHYKEFDYVLVNETLQSTCATILQLIQSVRANQVVVQPSDEDLVARLLEKPQPDTQS